MFAKTNNGFILFDKLQHYTYNLDEIIVSLSRQYRFNGHSNMTVLEHSYRMYETALEHNENPLVCFACLVHDFHEAYLGDISGPVEAYLNAQCGGSLKPALALLKADLDDAIGNKFDWPIRLSDAKKVPMYDSLMMWQEAHYNLRLTSIGLMGVDDFKRLYEVALKEAREYSAELKKDVL